MIEEFRPIDKFSPQDVPRDELAAYAKRCRLEGLPKLALRALYPFVRGEQSQQDAASSVEKSEYAMSLQQLGAYTESIELLRQLTNNPSSFARVPQAGLYLSFGLSFLREYQEAVLVLDQSLQQWEQLTSADNSFVQLLKLNRCTALMELGILEPLLEDIPNLIESLQRHGNTQLQANGLELLAQVYILSDELTLAQKALKAALDLRQFEKSWDPENIRKWSVVARALMNKEPDQLTDFRMEQQQGGHSESLRDLDFYLMKLSPSQSLFEYLYFGSPFESERFRLRTHFPQFDVPLETLISNPHHKSNLRKRLDLIHQVEDLGSLPHRMAHLLLRDFYRPLQIAELHRGLHPEEHFHPEHSANRVHQSLFATREWFKKQSLNLEIATKGSSFQLRWQDQYNLIARPQILPVAEDHISLFKLELDQRLQRREFWTRQDIQVSLGCSKGTAIEFIRRGIEQSQIKSLGAGPKTRYRLIALSM